MTRKLLVRQGGGAASFVDFLDIALARKGAPWFDRDTPLIQMGQRFANGESAMGYFKVVDPTAALSTTGFRLRPWAEVKLTEDASGDELTLGWMRVSAGDAMRRADYVGGDDIEHSPQLMDSNLDLRGIPFKTNWVRPAETDRARLEALGDAKLNGATSTRDVIRITTDITVGTVASGHLMEVSTPVDLEAKTYPAGSQVNDIISDIAEQSGKMWGVVLHHGGGGGTHKCLQYIDQDDFTTHTTEVRISDDLADFAPDDPDAPTFEPHWVRGAGRESNNEPVVSGLISIYTGSNDDPTSVYVETGEDPDEWETWVDVINDDQAKSVTQAERRATWQLNDRKRPWVSQRPSILVSAEQAHLVEAGMAIETKSVVMNSGPDKHSWVWRRVAEKAIEPAPDGRYWLHLSLERPRTSHGPGTGSPQPISTSPKPAPECVEQEPDSETILFDSRDGDWGSLVTTGACWGGDDHKSVGGSGSTSSTITVAAGDLIRGTFNFRDETGDDSWENNTNYNYKGYLRFSKAGGGGGFPVLEYPIIYERFHNTGCINVTRSTTQTVPTGYDRAQLQLKSKLGGYQFNGWLSEVVIADPVENDPDCLPAGTGGTSSHYARSDDTRFDADDQHLITKLQERVINTSGDVLAVGDVVIPDITATEPSVTTTTDPATTEAMVGVVTIAGGVGETVAVMWQGSILRSVNVDGTAAAGDYLYTSTTAGAADVSATRDVGAVGRVILEDGGDTTLVLWWGVPDSGSGTGGTGFVTTTDGGKEVISVVAAAGSTETLDLADGNVHDVTLTADCTLTLTGATNGVACSMTLLLRQGSGAPWLVTWPGSVEWVGGSAPTLETAVNAWNLVELITLDGGTTWFADAGGGTGSSSSSGTGIGDTSALFPGSTITLTKDAGNPTFNFNAIPETITKVGSTYYAVFQTSVQDDVNLATATDRDGPWTAYGGNPIYEFTDVSWAPGSADAIYAPEILEDDGTFYLFYSIVDKGDGTDGYIGVATASSITGPYTDHGSAILSPGAGSVWDSLRVGEPSVLHHDGQWIMAYMGEDNSFGFGDSEKVGFASASSPTGTWTKAAGNPLIDWSVGQWDDELTADPFIFFENGYYWCWYTGGTPTPWKAGLAYSVSPLTSWTKHDDNPLLVPGSGGQWDDEGSWRGSVYIEDGLLSGIYGGIPTAGSISGVKGGNFRLTVTSPFGEPDAAAHIADTTDAHEASSINVVDSGGNFTSSDVEGALEEELADGVAAVSGHYEVIVSGTAPPVAVTNMAEDDWVYGFVP